MKKLTIGILAVLGLGIAYGLYLFQAKPPDTRKIKAEYTMNADDLVREFSANEENANKKFVNHVIVVSGKVEEVKTDSLEASLMLSSENPMFGITCSFYSDEIASVKNVRPGMTIKVKGKCTGKLIDVVLNNCSLVR